MIEATECWGILTMFIDPHDASCSSDLGHRVLLAADGLVFFFSTFGATLPACFGIYLPFPDYSFL